MIMKKANKEAEPVILNGKKGWHIGKTNDGKEIFELEKGYAHLKNGKIEFGKTIDADGNFVPEEKKNEADKE